MRGGTCRRDPWTCVPLLPAIGILVGALDHERPALAVGPEVEQRVERDKARQTPGTTNASAAPMLSMTNPWIGGTMAPPRIAITRPAAPNFASSPSPRSATP